jgi:cytidine deaminase
MHVALEARQQAYAPYSQFLVGAALMAMDGSIYPGANVENGSLGLTICAERAAITAAVTAGQREFQALAVATDGGHTPCGACRQVLSEFSADLVILMLDVRRPDEINETTLGHLLPCQFKLRTDG